MTIRIGGQEPSALRPVPAGDDGGLVVDARSLRERAVGDGRSRGHIPVCMACGSDDALVYSTFSEQTVLPNGCTRYARAEYCCARCGRSRGHEVPANWRPPGWFWCT
ncbi:hypothetical protein [Arthrobacter sp. TMS2-4]